MTRVLSALLLAWVLAAPTFAKDEKPQKPQLTAEERTELRKLMGTASRGRHAALRGQAIGNLAKLGPKAEMAIPLLVNLLNDRDVSVATSAASALGKLGQDSKPAIKGLINAVTSGRDVELRRCAAEALGVIGPNADAGVPALMAALGHESADLRRDAAGAMGLLGKKAEEKAQPALLELLGDPDARVKVAAATSLGRLGNKDPRLVGMLGATVSPSSKAVLPARQAAAEALGKLGPAAKDAVPSLAAALRDRFKPNPALPYQEQRQAQHDDLRRACAVALGLIGPDAKEATDSLEAAEGESSLAEAAKQALEKIRGK
ncbi:MAG: HEAT repeat domain-containing protein [Planctomycetota bacterium]